MNAALAAPCGTRCQSFWHNGHVPAANLGVEKECVMATGRCDKTMPPLLNISSYGSLLYVWPKRAMLVTC